MQRKKKWAEDRGQGTENRGWCLEFQEVTLIFQDPGPPKGDGRFSTLYKNSGFKVFPQNPQN